MNTSVCIIIYFLCGYYKIGKEEVELGREVARCDFQVRCKDNSQPKALRHRVDVKGTNKEELFFTICRQPRIKSSVMPSKQLYLIFATSLPNNDSLILTAWKKPTLEKIKSLGVDVIGGIGTDYHNFGIHLLHDPNGVRVQAINAECLGNCEEINTAIIMRWLRGGEEGRPVTWAVLCEALKKAGLVTLADEVLMALAN